MVTMASTAYTYDPTGNQSHPAVPVIHVSRRQKFHKVHLCRRKDAQCKFPRGNVAYDPLNRMTSFDDGTVSETYANRGVDAVRTSKTSNGTTTSYLYDNLILNKYRNLGNLTLNNSMVIGCRAISEYENGT